MENYRRKNKTALQHLLRIPLHFFISMALFWVGTRLDLAMFSGAREDVQGHGIPFFTVIFLLVAAAWFTIATVIIIVKAIGAARRRAAGVDEM